MAQGKLKISTRSLVVAAILVAIVAFAVVKMRGGSSAGTGTDNGGSEVTSNDPKVALAQCLTSKGVKFFGASWCPHCAQQKKSFGSKAMKKVTYVECAVPGNNSLQAQICKDNNIKSYPTWRFPDGTEKTGEQTLEDLASAAGCSYGDVQAGASGTVLTNSGMAPDDTDNTNTNLGPRAQ